MGTKLTEEEKLKRKQEKELKQIEATISNAKQIIDTKLKQYIDSSCLINTEEDLHNYISTAIKDKEVAIDTETTGLDTYTDKIVGICLYSDSQKEAYIPINHIDYKTKELLPNQLPLEIVTKEMNRLKDSFIIMHNANFDIRVLRRIGVNLHCDWDTQIAANIINENENHKLKLLHQKYILRGQEDAFTFADLFSVPDDVKSSDKIKVTFDNIPIEIAKVYAAHDAKITKELKDWQYNGFIQCNPTLYEVFKNIEMPCVLPVCDMEDTGFIFDTEFHKKVEVKYHTLVKEKEIEIQNLIKGYKSQIEEWRKTDDANHKEPKLEKDGSIKYDSKGNIEYKKSKSEQLPDEINLNSPTQLSILFYDVLKTKVVDKKNPRGTGKEVLEKLKTPLSEALLAYRTFAKLVTSFIDSLPEQVKADGKIHCRLNQIGAATGRFSCIAEGQFVECVNGRKRIEDINIGDLVYCYDEDGKLVSSKVLNKFDKGFRECYRYNFIDWNAERTISLICTPDHRILTKNNHFVEAQTLIVGDKVSKHFLYSGTNEYVNKQHVWDLEVETYHNFIVSEICVHNCDDPNLQQIPARGEAEELRQLFTVPIYYRDIESENNTLIFKNTEEVEVQPNIWEFVKNLQIGDVIDTAKIINITINNKSITINIDNNIKCKCRERYILIGADYSQQEPKILAVACKDPDMIHAANINKDLYSTIAAKAFHTTYEDCLEHFPEGTPIKQVDGKWIKVAEGDEDKLADGITDTYKDGKLRRKQAKTILLGLMYGRGANALAEQLECSIDEARDIMNSVYRAFPKIKSFNDESIKFARKYGYITTLWGKKRRLPDARLEYLDIDWSNSIITNETQQARLKNEIIQKVKKLEWRMEERTALIKKYEKDYKIKIKLQSVLIARAERQVVNSVIQGSAADMTKKAIAAIANNKELKELKFNMIVPIHDEILGQCPITNAPRCIELFTYEMSHAATDKIPLDIKVDPTCAFSWAGEEVNLNEELERKI